MDENNRILTEPRYYNIVPINENFSIVSKVPNDYLSTNKIFYGVIDKNLQEIISPNKLKYSGERAYFVLLEQINNGTFDIKDTITCSKNNSIETLQNTKNCNNEFTIEIDKVFMNKNKYYMLCPHCSYIVEIPENKLSIEEKKY